VQNRRVYNIIGEAGGAFMPVYAECTGNYRGRPIFSIAHDFEQNGDLCCDPDCTFWVTDSIDVCAVNDPGPLTRVHVSPGSRWSPWVHSWRKGQ